MYTVLWGDDALEEVVRIWAYSDPSIQQDIPPAMRAIDKQLRTDPENAGESRGGGLNVLFEFPLGVGYRIDTLKQTVNIVSVWTFRKRR